MLSSMCIVFQYPTPVVRVWVVGAVVVMSERWLLVSIIVTKILIIMYVEAYNNIIWGMQCTSTAAREIILYYVVYYITMYTTRLQEATIIRRRRCIYDGGVYIHYLYIYISIYVPVCTYVIIYVYMRVYILKSEMDRERGVFFPYDSGPIVTRSGGTLCPINLFNI